MKSLHFLFQRSQLPIKSTVNRLLRYFHRFWLGCFQWRQKRTPSRPQQRLSHHHIYLIPSASGLVFLLMCATLFLLGTNYQNNLIILLSFLLVSLFHTHLILTYRNLSSLYLENLGSQPCHQNQAARFQIRLSTSRPRYQLQCQLAHGTAHTHDVNPQAPCLMELTTTARHRGTFKPGLLKIESRYPLGLCRAWSWQDLKLVSTVWPEAILGPVDYQQTTLANPNHGHQAALTTTTGQEEFEGLNRWQPGQSRSRIAWKQFAQQGRLQVKQFHDPKPQPQPFRLAQQLPLEQALCHLTAQIIQCEQQQIPYAIYLHNCASRYDNGPLHLQHCLTELAHYRPSVSQR
ncbi:MAG: DUF58 domain-containing protein [Ferrimonas sp.]